MNIHDKSRYHEVHARSLGDPEGFWAEAAREIDWIEPAKKVFDASMPAFYGRWFAGGVLNTCYNALDRHVEGGRANQTALIYDSPVTNTKRLHLPRAARPRCRRSPALHRSRGVGKGDRVIIYMPMMPEAVMAMLACARLGAVHSVVFGGFAAKELATRIDDAKPKLVLTASCGIEPGRIVHYKPLLDEAIELAQRQAVGLHHPAAAAGAGDAGRGPRPRLGRPRSAALKAGSRTPACRCRRPIRSTFSTRRARPAFRRAWCATMAAICVALNWSMKNLYGIEPGEVWWCASDVGWVVGHSYIVYGPLIHGATSILYEGKPVGTPDAGAFWRVISEHKAVALFTAPTAFRAIKKEDPDGKLLRNTTSRSSARCSSPASAAIRRPSSGRSSSWTCR